MILRLSSRGQQLCNDAYYSALDTLLGRGGEEEEGKGWRILTVSWQGGDDGVSIPRGPRER
jgi:hypothetical protein